MFMFLSLFQWGLQQYIGFKVLCDMMIIIVYICLSTILSLWKKYLKFFSFCQDMMFIEIIIKLFSQLKCIMSDHDDKKLCSTSHCDTVETWHFFRWLSYHRNNITLQPWFQRVGCQLFNTINILTCFIMICLFLWRSTSFIFFRQKTRCPKYRQIKCEKLDNFIFRSENSWETWHWYSVFGIGGNFFI